MPTGWSSCFSAWKILTHSNLWESGMKNMDNETKGCMENPGDAAQPAGAVVGEVVEQPARAWRPQDADVFEYKQSVRQRVRSSQAHPNAVFHKAKEAPTIDDGSVRKVAVYARVSTKSKNQTSSIENQQKYYTKRIQDEPNWDMGRIYSDEGFSGTSVRKRKAFQEMIRDAKAKDMDLILCASISRFSRNLQECLEYIDILRSSSPSHPVGVYFETENIYTLDPQSDQQLEIYAMLADWESANKSRRMILSYDQRISTGQYPVADLLGYRHTIDGDLIIQEDEAITVRFIFLAYILGYTYAEIAEILTDKGRPTLKGRTEWNGQMVRSVMLNERRWGDLNARKTIVINYKKGKTKKNEGERDWAFVPGYHQGIVSRDIAKAVRLVAVSNNPTPGISNLGVITEGILKGFVSISLGWNGVDNDTFHKICRSVYNDDELHEMEHEARILTGQEHSNVLSMSFTGYQVPFGVSFVNRSMPAVVITLRGVRFNKAAHLRMNNCSHIEILYHPVMQTIAIRPCDEGQSNAVCWEDAQGNMTNAFTSRAFAEAIYENMRWRSDLNFKFRLVPRERNGVTILMAALDEPQILLDKKTKANLGLTEESGPVQYIVHKVAEAVPDDSFSGRLQQVDNSFGVSMALRKLRDQMSASITIADIQKQTQIVDNPLIGQLPTRAEMAEELDDLLMCM